MQTALNRYTSTCSSIHVCTSAEANIEIFGYSFVILVIHYSFNVCTCTETKHIKKIKMAVRKLLASCYWFSRIVDQRANNKNTEVAVINIYCNYLQQNDELILNILQETIQTIYDE